MQFTHYVGIDVSKSWLDFAVVDSQDENPEVFRFSNTTEGVFRALKLIKRSKGAEVARTLFCLEHTGVYCLPFIEVAGRLDISVCLESAWKIKRSHSPRGKDDQLDAKRICIYARRFEDRIRLWAKEDDIILELKQRMALRQRLLRVITALEVPIKELRAVGAGEYAQMHLENSAPVIASIKAQLKDLDSKITQLIGSIPNVARNYELITSIPGIGRQTAIWMILYTHNFERIPDASKLACYAGVAPFANQSGSSFRRKARVSSYANKRLKSVLHMAALSAVRYNQDMRNYYIRKVKEGKNKMLVLNAVRKKLIEVMYAVIKRQSEYVVKPNNISQKIPA